MIPLRELADSLSGLIELIVPARDVSIDDITLLEAERGVRGVPGDLLLGVGVGTPAQAHALLSEIADSGVRALLLRRSLTSDEAVRERARAQGMALLGLDEHASWAHTVWLLRGLLDRTLSSGAAHQSPMEDLYAIADAAAALVDGSITIEDARSRVLAYSARQDTADTARVSTIVGRRVPESVLSHLRARGVFRRMTTSAEPFFLAAAPGSPVGSRMVIPVHAGGEWLGSLWAVVDAPTNPEVTAGLVRTANIVALHLLQLRSQNVLTRRVAMDRLRDALTGTLSETDASQWLIPGPWRVVALGWSGSSSHRAGPAGATAHGVDVWESVLRRESWHQPQLVEVSDHVVALVRESPVTPSAPRPPTGSWPWLAAIVTRLAHEGTGAMASAGRAVAHHSDLPRSLTDALEVQRARAASGPRTAGDRRCEPAALPAALTLEAAWAQVANSLATQALNEIPLPVPLARLAAHDERQHTAYLPTLAAWLDHPGATAHAAAALAIHPNTLRHRMVHISDLLGVDLHDPAIRLALRLHLDRPTAP